MVQLLSIQTQVNAKASSIHIGYTTLGSFFSCMHTGLQLYNIALKKTTPVPIYTQSAKVEPHPWVDIRTIVHFFCKLHTRVPLYAY